MSGLIVLNLIVTIICGKTSPILALIEANVTSTRSGNVCDLDNSCNISTTTAINEHRVEMIDASEKLKYNVSDTFSNDTLYRFNESADGVVDFEIDSIIENVTQIVRPQNETTPNQTTPGNTKYRITFRDDCHCDVTRGSCDLNCCCDRDCLNVNRDVFRYCIGEKSETKTGECRAKILNSPMLCIVKDNLYSRHFYPQHETNSAAFSINKLMKNRQVFGWPVDVLPHERKDVNVGAEFKQYEIDSPIWIYTRELKIKKFEIPQSTFVSRNCDNVAPIKFLNNYEITCTDRTDDNCARQNSFLSVGKYIDGFSFIRDPNAVNLSLPFNCSRHCVSLAPFICETDDAATCKLTNGSSLFKNNFCNVSVISAHYKIIHNGTEGIVSAKVYLRLETRSTTLDNSLRAVRVKVTHEWVNQSKYYELSGYPGYEFGRPVIAARARIKIRKVGENETTIDNAGEIEMSYDSSRWFTYFDVSTNGMCSRRSRNNVVFGENTYSHCHIAVPVIRAAENCERLQNEIYGHMFGAHFNISAIYVSSLGEPDVKDKSKWIPIAFDSTKSNIANETCAGLATSVKAIVLYSLVGDHDNPQRSIVAVKAVLHPLYEDVSKRDKLKIVFSVNFYDVTNPPMRIFAEPPTYEVKLPTDFFYPFFSSSAKRSAILLVETNVAKATIICLAFGSSKFFSIFYN